MAVVSSPVSLLGSLRDGEEGQSMAEYGVIIAVVSAGIVGAVALLSASITALISAVAGLV